jgi:HTH-type transcriptional regulator/antitoxin MqsA
MNRKRRKVANMKCPICASNTYEEKHGKYQFTPPPNIPGGPICITNATWWECGTCGEKVLSHELDKAIDVEATRRQGLLTPGEIRDVRKRTGLSAVDMAHLLGVGEKTYTRWETGKSIQNKANDTLIRLLDKNAEPFTLVEAEREPNRNALVSQYFQVLDTLKGSNPLAMAAHGGDLGVTSTESLRIRIREILAAKNR